MYMWQEVASCKCNTCVYRKPAHTNHYIPFHSHHRPRMSTGVLRCMRDRANHADLQLRSKETKDINTSRMSSKPMISLRILWGRCSSRNPTLLLNHLTLIQSHQRSSVYHMSHVAAYKLLLSHTLQFCNWQISVVKTSHHCSLVLHVNAQYQSSSWNSLSIITVMLNFVKGNNPNNTRYYITHIHTMHAFELQQ